MANNLSNLAIKAIQEVKENIKKLIHVNKQGKFYSDLGDTQLNPNTVKKAFEIKSQIDLLESQLNELRRKYQPLRDEILRSLPGEKIDKVEVLVDGIQVKKFAQIRGAGQLDQQKLLELAKNRKILTKVTKFVRVVDEEQLLLALHEGKISYDEYMDCLTQGQIIEALKLEQKQLPEIKFEESTNSELEAM